MSETDEDLVVPPPLGPELASGKWRVHVIDGDAKIIEEKISGKEVWSMLNRRVMVDFNRRGKPIKDSGGLFCSWLGSLSNDLNILPINYTDWRKVPNYRKEKTGREPSRSELFLASRTRLDGSLVCHEARISVDKLKEDETSNDVISSLDSAPNNMEIFEIKSSMKILEEKVDIVASALEALVKSRDINFQESKNGENIKVASALALLLQENVNGGNIKLVSALQVLIESCKGSENCGNIKSSSNLHLVYQVTRIVVIQNQQFEFYGEYTKTNY